MIVKNALVFCENKTFEKKDIFIENGYFSGYTTDNTIIDAQELLVIPGLIDIHLHGCMGYDFSDGTEQALDAICSYEGKHGITAFTPASMTLPEKTLLKICTTAGDYVQKEGALFLGINLEGPFFSEAKKGAQNAAYLRKPDISLFKRLQTAAKGKIKIACIAPELENAMSFIKEVSKTTVVSIAHTTANYDTAIEAMEQGASHITHLFNAMPPFNHRAPGVIGAGAEKECDAELICDGIHIHPCAIRTAVKLFGKEHIIFISDSMMATGLTDGMYSLGGQDVKVTGNLATLQNGTIAGSATNLYDCMKHAVSFGIPLEQAIEMASANPARSIGVYNQMGSISNGKLANFILIDKNLERKAVYIKGKKVS